jgi:hypothetical protein
MVKDIRKPSIKMAEVLKLEFRLSNFKSEEEYFSLVFENRIDCIILQLNKLIYYE